MIKDVFIFGTCRVAYLNNPDIPSFTKIRKYHSNYYRTASGVHIHTQPVNYTTKLQDIVDNILYMKGELYADKNPKEDPVFQSIFFRGHIGQHDTIIPKTHPVLPGFPIRFHKVVIEVFSIKQNIINTEKYGSEYYLKNLPWKIKTGYEHSIHFEESDIVVKTMTKEECFKALDTIYENVNCDVLVIGPYVSKKVPESVNAQRRETQTILKEYCGANPKMTYFDLSNAIAEADIEVDQIHLTPAGLQTLSDVIYTFIN
jgi:hypothetical protein